MKRIVVLCSMLTLIAGFFVTQGNVFADGWLAQGVGAGISRPTQGSCSGCSGDSVYETGVSWIYYAPMDDGSTESILNGSGGSDFTPYNPYGDTTNARIPEECKINGFWHFGRNQDGYPYNPPHFGDLQNLRYYNDSVAWGVNQYSTLTGSWGHLGTYTWGHGIKFDYKTYGDGSLDHWLYYNGQPVYHAAHYSQLECGNGDTSISDDMNLLKTCAWEGYKAAYVGHFGGLVSTDTNVENLKPYSFGSNVYAFCVAQGEVPGQIHVNSEFVTMKQKYKRTLDCDGNPDPNIEPVPIGEPYEFKKDVDYKVIKDEDDGAKDDWVRNYNTGRQANIDAGWEWKWNAPDPNQPNSIGVQWKDWNTFDADLSVDVKDSDRVVTVRYEKIEPEYVDEPVVCIPDPECKEWAPQEYLKSDEFNAYTRVRIGVINYTLEDYNNNGKWHHETAQQNGLMHGPVYAKPTDDVQWKYCYYPGVEHAAEKLVTPAKNGINTTKALDHPEPTFMQPTTNHIEPAKSFDVAYGSIDAVWRGKYKAWTEKLKERTEPKQENCEGRTEDDGDWTAVAGTLRGCKLEKNEEAKVAGRIYKMQPREQATLRLKHSTEFQNLLDPGDTLWGHIKTTNGFTQVSRTEEGIHRWRCNEHPCPTEDNPNKVCYDTCQHDNDFYGNSHSTAPEQDDAKVIVPYNYRNTASVKFTNDDDTEPYIFAGETVSVQSPTITVGTRKNDETAPDLQDKGYATQVEEGKARLVAYLLGPDDYRNEKYFSGDYPDNDGYSGSDDVRKNKLEDDDEGVIWKSTNEVCDPNGAYNDKFNVCKYLDWYPQSTGFTRLNENSNMDGLTYDFNDKNHYNVGTNPETNLSYNVFDEAAGNYFCISAAVYPFSVKSDTDTDKQGDQAWYVSKPVCKLIAKRPTFQVWGGGIFSAGGIKTSLNHKNNVLDYQGTHGRGDYTTLVTDLDGLNWSPRSSGNDSLFGSWGELSVTVEKTADKIASGAGTGYGGHNGEINNEYAGNTSPWIKSGDDRGDGHGGSTQIVGMGSPGGYRGPESFCNRSPLSLANLNCNSHIGDFVSPTLRQTLVSDVDAILQRFPNNGSANNEYEYVPVQSGTISETKTLITHESNITISSDIIYGNATGLTSLQDVPKYFIFSDNDITIDCGVTRIDAVLIAKGNVNTCDDGMADDDKPKNSSDRSHQLIINGTVVANYVELNRSYGTGTGQYSMVPAELINYDSTIYLWANREAEGATSGQLTETASRELAPRY